jgi:hypothetical protein
VADDADRSQRRARQEDTRGRGDPGRAGGGEYLAGVRAGLPFALATAVLGVQFGVLASSLGWGAARPDRVFGHQRLRVHPVRKGRGVVPILDTRTYYRIFL